MGECVKMDNEVKKLKKMVYSFMVLVIIVLAAFATTIYYYETKETSRIGSAGGTGMFAKAFSDGNVGTAPLAVNFSSLVFNFEGTPTYHWDFGDGNTSNEISPTHNYTKEGNYTCQLTIADETGKNATTSVNIIILANRPPQVVVILEPVDSPRPHVPILDYFPDPLIFFLVETLNSADSSLLNREGWIYCEGQAFDPEGDEIVSYEWELTEPPITLFGTTHYPKYYFEGKDLKNLTFPQLYTYRWQSYSIKLTVTDSAGNKASDVKQFGVGASDVVMRRANLQRKWNNFWDVQFYSLPTSLQSQITTTIWKLLGPAQDYADNTVEKILSHMPESIRNLALTLYYSFWETQEKTYRKPNNPPNIPENPSPVDSATGVGLNSDLSWNCTDPDGHRITYDIYFGTTSPPPLVISGNTNTTFELGPLDPSTTYYWKIVARDSSPTGEIKITTGPIWSFTTVTV